MDKEKARNYSKEYQEIIGDFNSNIVRQWHKPGDFFKKFTRYSNYSTPKSSGSTTLNSDF